MRIAVLNGVNLDVLSKRDPELYGGVGLSELETKIYQWALDLACTGESGWHNRHLAGDDRLAHRGVAFLAGQLWSVPLRRGW